MNKIIVALLLMPLFACQPEGRVFEEHEKLSSDLEWLKKDAREFKVDIEDESLTYKMSLAFRFANGYQYELAKVKVTEISPSGKEEVQMYSLKVRDSSGEYIGDPGYDIWDSEHLVEPSKKYSEKGEYTYVMEHAMPNDQLHFAMEVGLIIDK